MTTVFNYVTAFWSVVVMNCITPVNFQYCLPVHEWLIPELSQGIEIFFDHNMIILYESERNYLDNVVD